MEDGKDGRREGWKKGRMEDGKDGRREGWEAERVGGGKDGRREGGKFSVHAYFKPDGYIKSTGFANTVGAVLGFTTIVGAFGGIGVRARLACGRVVHDVPFNPTYGLSLETAGISIA